MVAALAVGIYHLSLPSGLVLELENCYFIPAINRDISSVSSLDIIGFELCCSFSQNNMFYGSALLANGLYILNQSTTIYNINENRVKPNDKNPTYLWHCRLGQINEKKDSRTPKDGLLDSFDLKSFETCESGLLGKMTKAPF